MKIVRKELSTAVHLSSVLSDVQLIADQMKSSQEQRMSKMKEKLELVLQAENAEKTCQIL